MAASVESKYVFFSDPSGLDDWELRHRRGSVISMMHTYACVVYKHAIEHFEQDM